MSSPSLPTNVPTVDVDVVIVGGGIQGLWLLADLIDQGYQAILLERVRPGFGQTGHSHVFLHEGHMYASMLKYSGQDTHQSAVSVLRANGLWQTALQTGRLKTLMPLKSNFYVGWDDQQSAEDFEERCERAALPYEKVETGHEFGALRAMASLYRSQALCLDSRLLLDHLLKYSNISERVGSCKEIHAVAYDTGKFNLLVSRPKDSTRPQDLQYHQVANRPKDIHLQIRAGALVLSAGAGNEKLINQLRTRGGMPIDPHISRQQTVKTFMLVVKHRSGSLPPVAGLFPRAGGIFIASRQDPQGRTVWLIADGQRELVSNPGEMTATDAAAWFNKLKGHLEKLLPALVTDRDNYEWGIYEATKAERWTTSIRYGEGGALPPGYYMHNPPSTSVWLTWPTLLTLAPLVADAIVGDLKQTVGPAQLPTDWGLWDDFRVGLIPYECKWKTTPLLSWDDFKRCFTSS